MRYAHKCDETWSEAGLLSRAFLEHWLGNSLARFFTTATEVGDQLVGARLAPALFLNCVPGMQMRILGIKERRSSVDQVLEHGVSGVPAERSSVPVHGIDDAGHLLILSIV
ncbi:hypothetical protein WOLCODRAFT_154623 [Wolfiporia cocos MD-104 SS10]|uniref:Uncharacterized protein n=1 Tax=Wolfiporia cocos (strain MD-104) TaxID=742152 RepID=A0A2H3JRM1_WOLCO|nr:hypothetical protein WOLCODRAFT_154623 [Wolfiporia cocos MD-104 SS10]